MNLLMHLLACFDRAHHPYIYHEGDCIVIELVPFQRQYPSVSKAKTSRNFQRSLNGYGFTTHFNPKTGLVYLTHNFVPLEGSNGNLSAETRASLSKIKWRAFQKNQRKEKKRRTTQPSTSDETRVLRNGKQVKVPQEPLFIRFTVPRVSRDTPLLFFGKSHPVQCPSVDTLNWINVDERHILDTNLLRRPYEIPNLAYEWSPEPLPPLKMSVDRYSS